jgi:acid stress-induced BolA-like protein IbaG/YrbA
MDKETIKEVIEGSLKGSTAVVDGSEGKYTASNSI